MLTTPHPCGLCNVMSKATKRKHVRREAVEDEVKPTRDQIIVKVGQFLVTACW